MTKDAKDLATSTDALPAAPASDYRDGLLTFERNLMTFIEQQGLPSLNVLVPVSERFKIFSNVGDVLALLSNDHKLRSVYISKFIAAAASGLFDAALNYLWDETIFELRKRIVRYDLEYFFDLAVKNPDKRKKLAGEDDLAKLDDNELIHGACEIGLISDLGFRHLDYVRYMRNWASAAHPNQNQITGLQLIAWFETCIKEVITLPETSATAQIRQLLANVKANALTAATARQVSVSFVGLTSDQASNLAAGFFGIYTNDKSLPVARDNVKLLAPMLWPFVSEGTRNGFGVKYGQFIASSDTVRSQWAREFLDAVTGASYIPDAIRAAEIGTAIEELLEAHRGFNNFHIEPSFARRLESLVGSHGNIPPQVVERYVEGLVDVYLTNGHGPTWDAEPIYTKLLLKLDATQVFMAVLSFRKLHIASKLQFPRCQTKYREVVAVAKSKVSSPQVLDILKLIENYRAPLDKMRNETLLMEKVNAITKSLGF